MPDELGRVDAGPGRGFGNYCNAAYCSMMFYDDCKIQTQTFGAVGHGLVSSDLTGSAEPACVVTITSLPPVEFEPGEPLCNVLSVSAKHWRHLKHHVPRNSYLVFEAKREALQAMSVSHQCFMRLRCMIEAVTVLSVTITNSY